MSRSTSSVTRWTPRCWGLRLILLWNQAEPIWIPLELRLDPGPPPVLSSQLIWKAVSWYLYVSSISGTLLFAPHSLLGWNSIPKSTIPLLTLQRRRRRSLNVDGSSSHSVNYPILPVWMASFFIGGQWRDVGIVKVVRPSFISPPRREATHFPKLKGKSTTKM